MRTSTSEVSLVFVQPDEPTTHFGSFDSYEALTVAADAKVAEGWTKLPCDCPRSGEIGYMLFRHIEREGEPAEESVILSWKPFGDVETHVTWLSSRDSGLIQSALDSLQGKKVFKCDDPRNLRLGFIHYDVPGVATLLEVSLSAVKGMGSELSVGGVPFRDWRAHVPDLRSVLEERAPVVS